MNSPIYGKTLQNRSQKFKHFLTRIFRWRANKFSQALVQIERYYSEIQQSKNRATWQQAKQATKQMLHINIFHPDLYFIVGGMALLVFATRSFTEFGIDYGPWRPVVISLAALLAGTIPMIISLFLFPLHILLKISTWILASINITLSANIFAYLEPAIPNYFYSEGVLEYRDLIYGIFVFYALALGYLHLRLNNHYCFTCYLKRHEIADINQHIPADKRGNIISLSAKDHYVQIVTDKGEHLNRMTMKETVALLPPETGILVHRSHWVAFNAMLSLNKNAERVTLTLRNGKQVPVSKAKVSEVKKVLDARQIT